MATRLFDRADLLAEHPAAGRRGPEYDDSTLRELVEPPYRIIHRYVEGTAVMDVLTVGPLARGPDGSLGLTAPRRGIRAIP